MSRTIFGVEVRTSILMSILFIIGGVATIIFSQIYYRKVPFEKIYINEAYEEKLSKQNEHIFKIIKQI